MRINTPQSNGSNGIQRSEHHGRGADDDPKRSTSFRETLRKGDGKREKHPAKHAGLAAGPDGTLVITAPIDRPPPGFAPPQPRPATTSRTDRPQPARSPVRGEIAITDVKVGTGRDGVRVHARIAEGRHTGVEVRAVESNGKVSIELVTRHANDAKALEGELERLRESLRARGLEGVAVDVRAAGDGRRGSHSGDEQRESDARTGDASEPVSATTTAPATAQPDDDMVW